ncbi:MAG: parallel beta-helix domain-containing protein [Myxococcota bacterium]
MTFNLPGTIALLASAAWLGACSGDDAAEGESEGEDLAACVAAGDTEAALLAFVEAADGSTVCFESGTYAFTGQLDLTASGVTIRGDAEGETVFDFSGQTDGPNGIAITGDGVTVESLKVLNAAGDGIRATDVQDIAFRDIDVIWDGGPSADNGAYGLYPVGSSGVTIERCTVAGASDAGIYVGQSERVLVADSEAYGNVAGIEIENSVDAEVTGNHAHDNTGGILVFNLPGLSRYGSRANVHDNVIEDNNQENFAPGGTVQNVPPGSGVIILASDGNEVHANTIQGNQTVGVLIISYVDIVGMLLGSYTDEDFEPYAQGNWIHDNAFADNGTDPQGAVGVYITGALDIERMPDMNWDGCTDAEADNAAGALDNCFSDNGDATYLDFDMCGALENWSNDLAPVTCEHEALPAID